MAISGGIGGTAHIAPVRTETQRTSSAYPSLTFTKIGGVESWSDFGTEGSVVSFTPLEDGVTRNLVGAINPGQFTLTCADDPTDAGQIAVKAGIGTRRLYPIKLLAADGADSNDIDSGFYFGVRLLSGKPDKGKDGVSKIVFVGVIDTLIHEVPASGVSGGS